MTHRDHHFHHHDQQAIQSMVDYQGFALFHGGGARGWSHTIGLYDPHYQRPELFIWGLTLQLRVAWLLDLGFQMQGPPSSRALLEESRALGIPIAELGYHRGGKVFETGRVYRFAEGELPGCFGMVEPHYYEEFLWHARAYHEHADFSVLQYTWSDPVGRFPWDEACDPRTRLSQRLLFDPQQYLPLSEGG